MDNFTSIFLGSHPNIKNLTLTCMSVFLVVMGAQILNYAVVNPRITIDPIWIDQLTIKCGASSIDHAFSTLSLV